MPRVLGNVGQQEAPREVNEQVVDPAQVNAAPMEQHLNDDFFFEFDIEGELDRAEADQDARRRLDEEFARGPQPERQQANMENAINNGMFRWQAPHPWDGIVNNVGEAPLRANGAFGNGNQVEFNINADPFAFPPQPPVEPGIEPVANALDDLHNRIMQQAVRLNLDGRVVEGLRAEFAPQQNRRIRRGAALAVDDGRHIPRDIAREPEEEIQVKRAPLAKKAAPVRKVDNKKLAYPEDGVMHFSGHKFARSLTFVEDQFLRNYGYRELLLKYKDLEFKEKEKPVNDQEEVILTISELADHYATEECTKAIADFDIKTHNKEYQIAYKRHVKVIASFKRNKNG